MTLRVRLSRVYLLDSNTGNARSLDGNFTLEQDPSGQTLSELLDAVAKQPAIKMPSLSGNQNILRMNSGDDWRGKGKQKKRRIK